MVERNPMMVLDDMGSAAVTSSGEEGYDQLDKMGVQKIPVLDETNSDSFVLDMERFSHLTDKDMTANSRITRARKWQGRVEVKKTNSIATKEKDNPVDPTSSTRGSVSTLGEAIAVPMGATDHHHHHHHHNQITIVTGNIGNTIPTNAESSRLDGARTSFRRWRVISPRRIFMLCAILSSIGSLLMIYFTLSLGNHSGEDSDTNW